MGIFLGFGLSCLLILSAGMEHEHHKHHGQHTGTTTGGSAASRVDTPSETMGDKIKKHLPGTSSCFC